MAPAKRKVSKVSSGGSVGGSDDEDYRKKRDRNNQAVKRSRVKSKQKASESKGRVNKLQSENDKLQERIRQKQSNLETLKSLFLETAKAKSESGDGAKYNLKKLLADSDDEDTPGTAT